MHPELSLLKGFLGYPRGAILSLSLLVAVFLRGPRVNNGYSPSSPLLATQSTSTRRPSARPLHLRPHPPPFGSGFGARCR